MPSSGCAPSAFHARARYRTLPLAMLCMACAVSLCVPALRAESLSDAKPEARRAAARALIGSKADRDIQAVKAALSRAESEILKRHAGCCVAEAIASGDESEQRRKFGELIDLFEKAKR